MFDPFADPVDPRPEPAALEPDDADPDDAAASWYERITSRL